MAINPSLIILRNMVLLLYFIEYCLMNQLTKSLNEFKRLHYNVSLHIWILFGYLFVWRNRIGSGSRTAVLCNRLPLDIDCTYYCTTWRRRDGYRLTTSGHAVLYPPGVWEITHWKIVLPRYNGISTRTPAVPYLYRIYAIRAVLSV